MSKKPHSASAQSGFTMVVIAALFIAFAVIAAAAVERNTTVQQITRRDAAREQLQRLSNAIIEYSVFNASAAANLYPCPARLDTAFTNAAFGQAEVGCATLSDSVGPPVLTAGGIPVMGAQNSAVLRGMVPVKDLSNYGISINDAFDPWNNRIMYVVNRTLTFGSAGPSQGSNPTIAHFVIDPFNVSVVNPAPDFILISYGRDGVGGHKRSTNSTTATLACATSSLVYRLENCDVDTAYLTSPTYTAGDAIGNVNLGPSPALNAYFDDILTWYRQ